MLCNGKCFKGNKKCGLYYEIRMHNILLKKDEIIEKCAFLHMADSYIRIEERLIGIQAAVESSRNETANADNKMSSIVATGFIGMMHAFNKDKTKFENSMKLLSSAGKEVNSGTIPNRIG